MTPSLVEQSFLRSDMERKSQNLEFITKLSVTNENEIFVKPSTNLIVPNNPKQCKSVEDYNSIVVNHDTYDYSDNDFEDGEKQKQQMSSNLQTELSKYKKQLREYTNTTHDLEEKCLKINFKLSEMQQKHNNFVAKRNNLNDDRESDSDTSRTDSEELLQKKYTQIFNRGNSCMRSLSHESQDNLNMCDPQTRVEQKRHRQIPATTDIRSTEGIRRRKRYYNEIKENEPPLDYIKSRDKNRRDMSRAFKTIVDVVGGSKVPEVDVLQTTINNLQTEQNSFRTIIEQQQCCLEDYHTRCIRAQHIMQTQQIEIEKLNSNNRQLETDITAGIDQLQLKIEAKLREVAQLPQMMINEQTKYDRIVKENGLLSDRIRTIQDEANHLKVKIDEIGRRKNTTMGRLKTAERDLKIFKNYNTALKHEKRKLNEELQKMREHMNSMDISSKRTMIRQREQIDKQRRELQKRIYELELKLSHSQNSTTSLIQERDSLIAELQTQLNTLVHNFEVSQKHIRVLRRHIYSITGGTTKMCSSLK